MGMDDDLFMFVLRVGSDGVNGGCSGYEDIFVLITSASAAIVVASSLSSTSYLEILVGMFGDDV